MCGLTVLEEATMTTYDETDDLFICGTCEAEFRVEVFSADTLSYCPCCGGFLSLDDDEEDE